MNAPRRHSRPEPNQPTSTYKNGGGKSKLGGGGGKEVVRDEFGEPVGKRSWKNSNPRKTWGA